MPWFQCKTCGERYYSSSELNYLFDKKCDICDGDLKRLEEDENISLYPKFYLTEKEDKSRECKQIFHKLKLQRDLKFNSAG